MFSIAPYRISVVQNNRTIPLWNPEGTAGFPVWFYSALSGIIGDVVELTPLSRSRVHSLHRNADSTVVCGIFQTGENGFTSELVDTETGQVNHNRLPREAEFIPFFFMLSVPKDSDFGILALQKFKNMGIRDALASPLIERFTVHHPGKRLRVNRLVPAELAQQLLGESEIKAIRLINYPTNEEASASLGQGYEERTHSVEMVFRAHRQGSLPLGNLVAGLTGRRPVGQLFEVDGFNYEKIKLELEINGKRRVLDLGRPDVVTPNVDVTNDLQIDISGHPTLDSLIEIFGQFSQDTFNQEGNPIVFDFDMVEVLEADPLPPRG